MRSGEDDAEDPCNKNIGLEELVLGLRCPGVRPPMTRDGEHDERAELRDGEHDERAPAALASWRPPTRRAFVAMLGAAAAALAVRAPPAPAPAPRPRQTWSGTTRWIGHC